MNFKHHTQDQVMIIDLESESLDARAARPFKENLIKLAEEQRTYQIILNLENLTFIDSSGLGSFLSVLRLLNSKGGDLKLCAMSKQVRSMFELVRMHKLFEIFNSPTEAKRSFNG